MIGGEQGNPVRLGAPLATAPVARGGETESSHSGPVWVAGVVGQREPVVDEEGVGLGLSLVQSAHVLEGGAAPRVGLVHTVT